jgi:hypothetical protein
LFYLIGDIATLYNEWFFDVMFIMTVVPIRVEMAL